MPFQETSHEKDARVDFLRTGAPRSLLLLNVVFAVAYFLAIVFFFNRGNEILFWILVAGEVFHLWQLCTFIYTVWDTSYKHRFDPHHCPRVDVFIPVAGEPVDIIEETVRAAKEMDYPRFSVHILNDGLVAGKENWKEVEYLAERIGVSCITRTVPGGAKAGNINNALSLTSAPIVAILDADHVPHRDFLSKTAGYFADTSMGFVQTPQYYKNHNANFIAAGSWDQQALFFGAILKGKNRLNSTTMCGTNMLIRRESLLEVGGMCEKSIAEDFITGMFIHEKGWKSAYVPEVLAEGLAPEDFLSYYKQQFRWARGSLDLVFRYHIFLRRGLSLVQKIQYLSSVSFFLSGLVVFMNACIPLIFFFTC